MVLLHPPFLGHEGDSVVVMRCIDEALVNILGSLDNRRDLKDRRLAEENDVLMYGPQSLCISPVVIHEIRVGERRGVQVPPASSL